MAMQIREDSKQRAHEASEKATDRAQMNHLITKIAAGYFEFKKKIRNKKKSNKKRRRSNNHSSSSRSSDDEESTPDGEGVAIYQSQHSVVESESSSKMDSAYNPGAYAHRSPD